VYETKKKKEKYNGKNYKTEETVIVVVSGVSSVDGLSWKKQNE